jgi:hypothetical protein
MYKVYGNIMYVKKGKKTEKLRVACTIFTCA